MALKAPREMVLEEDGDGELAAAGQVRGAWSLHGVEPHEAARRLAEASVSVRALGGLAAAPFVDALRSVHVRAGGEGQFGVVLTDDYLHDALADYNLAALRDDRPWLLVRPVGGEIWVGPLFRPGRTGCWECLAQRLRVNRETEPDSQHRATDEPAAGALDFTAATLQIAWNLAATAVAEWVVRGELPALEGVVLSFDLRSWQSRRHTLVCRPQCPACGDALDGLDLPAWPVVLQSRSKGFTADGGHRIVSPEATLERYEHHVSPITGVVIRLESCAATKNGALHTYVADHGSVRRPWQTSAKVFRDGSGGKGVSDLQARASGLCEALERCSGIFRGEEPRRRGRLADLGDAAIHPNTCMGFSDKQYRERDAVNALGRRFGFVPLPFDEEAVRDWTPVWSLTRRQERLLPTEFCYYRHPGAGAPLSCVACSNGCAAGNTLEEAVLQGFLELVERDGVALWWYNRLRRPAVDLDGFGERSLLAFRAELRGRGRDLWLLDLTADLGVPVFAALSRRTDRQPEQIVFGFGAHLDARLAASRAVTELNQMLFWTAPSSEEDGLTGASAENRELAEWLATASLANQPYLAPDPAAPPRAAADYPRRWSDDLAEDVRACQALVERQGLEMLVLDQTRPDMGLPVVKVFVPGLRHFWPRFAPGRLYDVPVRLGWLPAPLTEDQLNPIPMFW